MARPRIFISSTYYDLKSIRADLERYVKDRGFDPVLSERGQIPYGSDAKLEEYCYKEIEHCDILISVIGGRFGSSSSHDSYSISQKELKKAIDLGRPVYVFVEKSVLAEHKTYEKNKESKDIEYAAVDNISIYRFIDEIFALPINNTVAPFETSSDIIEYLQEQWAGLFQRLLREASRQKEVAVLDDLKNTAKALSQLVTFLTEERRSGDEAIKSILLTNHPIFEIIRKELKLPVRVFFTNKREFVAWLKVRKFVEVESSEESFDTSDSYEEWINRESQPKRLLKISFEVFDEHGRLKIVTPEEWRNDWVIGCDLEDNYIPDDVPF